MAPWLADGFAVPPKVMEIKQNQGSYIAIAHEPTVGSSKPTNSHLL
jgi:hypothetical protein